MKGTEAYRTLVRPGLCELLGLVRLDVAYERAEGCYLWYRGTRVLDLVGGYGTLLLGHNHPDLVRAAVDHFAAPPARARPGVGPRADRRAGRAPFAAGRGG